MQSILLTIALVLSLTTVNAQTIQEFKADASHQQALNLTIYNQGRALIRDRRQFDIDTPVTAIAFSDVAQKIMPQTVAIDGLNVREQNYDYDLLSPQALIQKHLGKRVRIARRSGETGETLEWTQGTIVSSNGGVILRMDDGRLESLSRNHHYHIVFEEIPDNLRASPTLSLKLHDPVSGQQQVDMTYLSHGLSWQSDYVLQLSTDEQQASLDSWITLSNQSGISYNEASLQLLAGDVNTVTPGAETLMMADTMLARRASKREVREEALHGYHLYTVPFPTTLRDNQNKQIALFSASAIPLQKRLEDRAWLDPQGLTKQKSKPEQILRLQNNKPALGIPLPKGTIRVYGQDRQGGKQFLGEDRIEHTAVNDEVEIKIGRAFDVSIERQTREPVQISKQQQRLTRTIRLNNGSDSEQQVELFEIMPTADWQILTASHQHDRSSPREAKFVLTIPAMSKLDLEYRIELRYR